MFRISAMLVALAILPGSLLPMFALDPRKALTQYSESVWTQKQGLPEDAVRAVTQTSDGYLWLGTDEGLARFDGYEFVSFSRVRGAPASNSISALVAGKDGSLWIGSRNGLTRYKDGLFRTYTRKDGLNDDLVSSLFVDHAGILWIVAGGNLSRFDGAHFTNFVRERDIPLRSVRDVTESRNHEIYVCGNSSVARLVDGRFVEVIGPSVLAADFPSHIQVDKFENLWITGARGVIERLPGGTVKRYRGGEGLSDSFGTNTIVQDSAGTIWVGTNWGLARLEGPRFHTLPEARDGAAIRCIFEDREGNLWVGSDDGLTRYRDDVFTSLGKSEGLPDNGPIAILEDHQGTVWAGFDNGLWRLNGLRSMPDRISNATLFLRHLRETTRGELLAPSRQGLIRIRNGVRTTFIAPDPQGRKTVFDVAEARDGTLWLALPNGLGELKGNNFRSVIAAGPLYLDDSFYVLAIATDGAVWAGSLSDGLWRYQHGEKRLFTTADGLGSNQIRSLHIDHDGTLWIGTLGGGLNVFRNGRFVRYRARDGLLSDNIYSITDDGQSLWLGTPRGICRIPRPELEDFAENRIKLLRPASYGVDDGLRSARTTGGQVFADGTLWFATSRGIAIYDPHVSNAKLQAPLIHINEISTDNRSIDNRTMDNHSLAGGPYRFPAGSGHIRIGFTGIHLRAPDRVNYSYMLDGLDTDWISAGGLRAVNYDSLHHGHYRFHVKAELPGGPASESALEFDIAPHYYETGWFRGLCLALLAMMVWTLYKYREGQVRSRFRLVLEERARLARELHDTLAQGFVGIASQLEAVEMTMPAEADDARNALDLARRMTRHSLTEARRSLMDLRATALTDQDLAVALESGAERWAANSGVEVKVKVSGDASHLPEQVAHHVFRIAQEAVANAVNHAAPNCIFLELNVDQHELHLHVEDDGEGFDPDDAFTSNHGNFGLIGMRERAQRLQGELCLDSQPGEGTRLDIKVPLR